MKEMTALEYFKEKERMTKNCEIDCEECPLFEENNPKKVTCVSLQSLCPSIAISIVQKWSEEHQGKMMLQDFLEKYPKAPLYSNGTPQTCPYKLGYIDEESCDCNHSCTKCWNRPMEAE